MDKENIQVAEKPVWKINGFIGLVLLIIFLGLSIYCFFLLGSGVVLHPTLYITVAVISIIIFVILATGMVIVQPNTAAVVIFFGRYIGCIRQNGIWLTVPFSVSKKVSLRIRNFNSERLKVNDINGNPIEIAAVIVFRVIDAAKALLDVNNYEEFVEIQSETSLRHVAAQYPYDNFDEQGFSLRANADEVSTQLLQETSARLSLAGVEVLEARLTHLAYATEIASAMLQRQQASAILAARRIIVDGAVGMATMAIDDLQKISSIELDDERKVNMINNIMVAIIADRSSQPVINVGSMY